MKNETPRIGMIFVDSCDARDAAEGDESRAYWSPHFSARFDFPYVRADFLPRDVLTQRLLVLEEGLEIIKNLFPDSTLNDLNELTNSRERLSKPELTVKQYDALMVLLEGRPYSEHVTWEGREYFHYGGLWVIAWRSRGMESGDPLERPATDRSISGS